MNRRSSIAFGLWALFTVTGFLSLDAFAHGTEKHPEKEAPEVAGPEKHWAAPEKAAQQVNPVAATKDSVHRGKKLYRQNCTKCHGRKGHGDGPKVAKLKSPPGDLTEMAGHHPDGDLAWKIAEGRGDMPDWKEDLTQTEIWDLVNYIKTLAGSNRSAP